jgi:hypothetical protein
MANVEKVGVRYIKSVQQKAGRGNWDTTIARTEGEVTYVPAAVADELVRTGVAVRLAQE